MHRVYAQPHSSPEATVAVKYSPIEVKHVLDPILCCKLHNSKRAAQFCTDSGNFWGTDVSLFSELCPKVNAISISPGSFCWCLLYLGILKQNNITLHQKDADTPSVYDWLPSEPPKKLPRIQGVLTCGVHAAEQRGRPPFCIGRGLSYPAAVSFQLFRQRETPGE